MRRHGDQLRPRSVEQDEVFKLDQSGTAQASERTARPDTDPGEFACDAATLGLATCSADADDSVKVQVSDTPHAVTNSEAPQPVWIARMGTLVGQDAKGLVLHGSPRAEHAQSLAR